MGERVAAAGGEGPIDRVLGPEGHIGTYSIRLVRHSQGRALTDVKDPVIGERAVDVYRRTEIDLKACMVGNCQETTARRNVCRLPVDQIYNSFDARQVGESAGTVDDVIEAPIDVEV